MPENIGPVIGVDGEPEYRKQMKTIIQQSKELAAEMKMVTSEFDKNDRSQKNLTAQMGVLGKQIQTQKERIGILSESYRKNEEELSELETTLKKTIDQYGKESKEAISVATAVDKQAREVSRVKTEYNQAQTALNKMNREMEELENESKNNVSWLKKMEDGLDDAGKSASSFGEILGAGAIIESIKGIASSISDVIESTKEYRKIMGSLEVSSENAGYSAKETEETYRNLYGVLGDEQTAATTTANLQALGLEQDKLTDLTNMAIGAWAKYGDSIPIDSLSEAINETIKTGTVTGTFADVLNWAGTSEDDFNTKLQAANSEIERANIVMQEMARQGLGEASAAWQKNNEDLVAANQAQADFQENAAQLSERLSPVMTTVKNGFNDIFKAILEITKGIDFNALAEQIKQGFQFFIDNILPKIVDFFKFVMENKDTIISIISGIGAGFAAWNVGQMIAGLVKNIGGFISALKNANFSFSALNATMKANVIILIISLIAGIVTAIINLWNTNEDFRSAVTNIWNGIKETFTNVVDAIVGFFTETIPNAASSLVDKIKETVSNIAKFLLNIRKSIDETVGNIKDSIVSGIQKAIDFITSLPGKAIQWGKDMINGFVNGIKKAIGGIVDAVSGIADTIAGFLHFSRPDMGPLREYEKWMPDMISGMAEGIRKNAYRLENAVGGMALNMAGGMQGATSATTNTFSIIVNAAQGQSEEQIADAVMRRMQHKVAQKEAVYR